MASTVSLAPEPIPLEVKVVLVGPPTLYYLLSAYDEEFADLFKIAADFEDRVERTPGNDAALCAADLRDDPAREVAAARPRRPSRASSSRRRGSPAMPTS